MPSIGSLISLVGPAVEPVSLQLAKKHLRIDHNDDDDLVALYLTSARIWAENYQSRALIQQVFLYTVSEQPFTGAFPYVGLPFPVAIYPLWYPWPNAFNRPTELPRVPLISVNAVTYGTWGEADTTIDPSFYQVDVGTARVNFLPGALPTAKDHIAFEFTAGYGADGSFVPGPTVAGILMLLGCIYENRGDVAADMPQAAKSLLTMFRRPNFG